ncbi:MAG: exonuclease subunit SbcD, partial [Clostridia bacterium]|nr:exonuclease subunit SbcD [Clostridia bacterium]
GYTPSAEAERVFFDAVAKMSESSAVALIPGNHDDATRLCASSPFGERSGAYFFGEASEENSALLRAKTTDSARKGAWAREKGEGYAIFENAAGEKVYLAALPYPTEARLKERASDIPYTDRVAGWLSDCLAANTEGLPAVLMTHVFTVGGLTTEGEREISLGGARAVDKNSIPEVAYVALGHLHKRQVVSASRNIIYSGSILQYSFDEVGVEKSVTVFDISASGAKNIRKIPLTQGRRLARLFFTSYEDALQALPAYSDHVTELTLGLKSPLNREENDYLAKNYPRMKLVIRIEGEASFASRERREMDDRELFIGCYKKQFGADPADELTALYLEILMEAEEK